MNIPDMPPGEVAAGGAGILGIVFLIARRLGLTVSFGSPAQKVPDTTQIPTQCQDHSALVVQVAEIREDVRTLIDRQSDIGENVAAIKAGMEGLVKSQDVSHQDINTLFDRMRETETRTTVLEKKGG